MAEASPTTALCQQAPKQSECFEISRGSVSLLRGLKRRFHQELEYYKYFAVVKMRRQDINAPSVDTCVLQSLYPVERRERNEESNALHNTIQKSFLGRHGAIFC